jgi:hypothetical protein
MTKAARERSGDFALRDLSLIVLAHYFEGLETTVAKATRRVYDSVRSVRPGRFRQDLELNRDVLHIAIFVERVSMQVEDVNNLIARNSSELEELKSDFRGDADATLGKHLQLAIPRHVRRIQRTSAATADAFARYLGLQNIRTTYNLQRGLFWLTIATIVIGGLTLYFTWRQGRHDVNVRTDAVQHSS